MTAGATETPPAARVHDDDDVAGAWVHSHNLATRLTGEAGYVRRAHVGGDSQAAPASMPFFDGYRRADGRVATRNEIWVLNTVGCVNTAAERIARAASERFAGRIDGVHAFAHPYGCSQLGDDLKATQAVLGGLLRNPNAGGALGLGLGRENNQLPALLRASVPSDATRVRSFNTQPVPTRKVSSNSDIAARKPHWIDFDAGRVLTGEKSMEALTDDLLALVLEVASGRTLARNEEHGYREIAIWKHGVTL